MQGTGSMKNGTVKSTMIWQWRQEERWRKAKIRITKFFGWLFLILFLNGIGWVFASLLVTGR
jgi:hypothetical protein